MKFSLKTKFFLTHLGFLLSLFSIYFIPYLYPLLNEKYLPPLNRYIRFYIIGVFLIVFFLYYLCLHFYNKLNIQLFKLNKVSVYFWSTTIGVLVFLCFSHALLSFDLYEYPMRARMLSLYHMNPYLHIPQEIRTDIFFPEIFWKTTPESYGPLWVLIGTLHTYLFQYSVALTAFMHKFILLLFLGGCWFVFYKLCLKLSLPNSRITALAFALNPLVIIMTVVDGHNEIAMVFCVLCSLYLLLRGNYAFSLLALALAINIKFVYVLLVPLYVLYILLNNDSRNALGRLYSLVAGAGLSFLATFLLWLPFGKQTVAAVFKYYRELSQNFWPDSIPYLLWSILGKVGIVVPRSAVADIFSLLFLMVYGYLIYYFIRIVKYDKQAVFTASSLMILALLFTNSTPFQSWYLLWVMPFILLSRLRSRFLVVFLLSLFLIMAFWKRMSTLAVPMMFAYLLMRLAYNKHKEKLRLLFSLE